MPHTVVLDTQAEACDIGLRKFYGSVFAIMALALAITGVTAWWIGHSTDMMTTLFHLKTVVNDHGKMVQKPQMSGWWLAASGLQLLMVWWLSGSALMNRISKSTGTVVFLLYAFLSGVTLAPVAYAYTAVSLATTFFISAATFGACALWGVTTKVSLGRFASFFRMALIGIIIALVANYFLQSRAMDYMVSLLGILLFAGLTAFDMQKLEQMYDRSGASRDGLVIYGGLTLYLDFVNFFLFFLRFFGVKKD